MNDFTIKVSFCAEYAIYSADGLVFNFYYGQKIGISVSIHNLLLNKIIVFSGIYAGFSYNITVTSTIELALNI